MISINLMDWRDQARAEQKKQFFMEVLAAALFAIIILLFWHWNVGQQISMQHERNTFLTQKTADIESQIQKYHALSKEKAQLLANLQLIQDLHNSKYQIVGMLDELAHLIPKEIYLNSIMRENDQVVLIGTAQGNANITQLMKNMEKSNWLADSELRQITELKTDDTKRQFELVTALKRSSL